MISITIRTIAAALAAQKVKLTLIEDSQPTILCPDHRVMVFYDQNLCCPVVMSHELHRTWPVCSYDGLVDAFEHIARIRAHNERIAALRRSYAAL